MTEITAQQPAEGILKTHDFGDAMYYTVMCQCQNPDDMIHFSVELEADAWNIVLNSDFTPKSPYWKRLVKENGGFDNSFLWSIDCSIRSLINSLYHKFMVTWEVWTQGYVKYYQSTIMSEQQALNYAATINQSIEDLRKFKQTINNNSNDKIDTDANDGC